MLCQNVTFKIKQQMLNVMCFRDIPGLFVNHRHLPPQKFSPPKKLISLGKKPFYVGTLL
jgi:hypothetical protein